jgi:predicted transcriptional regulator
LPSADTEIQGQDRWNAIYERGELLRKLGLYTLRVIEGKVLLDYTENNAFRILKKLLQLGGANVYELAKFSKNAGHYSTILRALRRMEKRGLVKVVPKDSTSGRNEKVYEVTLFGELIESLASGGWKGMAEKIAVIAPRFQDCQRAYERFDPSYYWHHAYSIVESLMRTPMPNNVKFEIERVVTENEGEWIKTNLIKKLNDPQTVSQNLHYLKELSDVQWIGCIVLQLLDEYYSEWEKWLKTLNAFRHELSFRFT